MHSDIVEGTISAMEKLLSSGDVGLAAKFLEREDAWLATRVDEGQRARMQALREDLPEWQRREVEAGGPGSLLDLRHSFQQDLIAARNWRDPAS